MSDTLWIGTYLITKKQFVFIFGSNTLRIGTCLIKKILCLNSNLLPGSVPRVCAVEVVDHLAQAEALAEAYEFRIIC